MQAAVQHKDYTTYTQGAAEIAGQQTSPGQEQADVEQTRPGAARIDL
jgi:hypothetical protein